MGALIMVHSDDNGLVLPPKLAPIQVVIKKDKEMDEDTQKDAENEVQKLTDKYTKDIDAASKKKQDEVLKV